MLVVVSLLVVDSGPGTLPGKVDRGDYRSDAHLCIFFRKQMIAVLGVCGGKQYYAILGDRSSNCLIDCKVRLMVVATWSVVSWSSSRNVFLS